MQEHKAKAINPATGEVIGEYEHLTEDEIEKCIQKSWNTFLRYKKSDPKTRAEKLSKLADYLEQNLDKFAKTITMEMGKPIKESKSEVKKSVNHCRYYAEHIDECLKPDSVSGDAKKILVLYQPLGPIYHITPFNFPLWLILKGVIPCIAMGNTVINKNPTSCPKIGMLTEEAFQAAGFDNGEFQNLVIGQHHSELILKNPSIRGVSLTGSTNAGSKIAAMAGKYCKKSVMELGGNDPFIVLKDADLDQAVEHGANSRLRNTGQACNAAKRFIVDESIYEEFKQKLIEKVKGFKVGDPMDEDTQIGPLAKKSGLEKLIEQVQKAKEDGGKLLYGGVQPDDDKLKNGHFFLPTIFECDENNSLLNDETFGPIFALIKFKSEKDAVRIANNTEYGLSSTIFSKDEERAQKLGEDIDTGVLYINKMVSTGSNMPSGGVKASGFGREGGIYGAHEFVNIKTVYIA